MALRDVYAKPLASLDDLGGQLAFHIAVLKAVPRSVTRYPREIMRILAEVTLGSGALAVIGGTVGVIIGMTFFTGAQVGLSGYAALNQLGTAAFSAARSEMTVDDGVAKAMGPAGRLSRPTSTPFT